MAQKNLITMTQKELSRYEIIKKLLNKEINGTDAAKQIGVSVRQIRNLKSKVKKYGAKGIIHANIGKPSNRRMSKEKRNRIERIIKKNYSYFGPTFAAEKLDECHGIIVSNEKLRSLMTKWNLWKPKPRKQAKNKHFWRPRKDNFGEMDQFDGSYHHWFGEEESCLLLSVDDATGKITHAKFDTNESVVAVFKFWTEYFEKNGLPISIYLDKFSTYKVNHKNAADNKDMITQFERATNQIGVKLIKANSPQAKGRIERMNKTLQDRLVKELRLANISTMEKANEFFKEYIPKFNAKFSVVPSRRANLHKPLNKTIRAKLPQIFSVQDQRKIMNDYTIRFETMFYQLNETQPTTVYKKDLVVVERHLNGEIKINLKGHYLNYTELPERPKKEINVKLLALTNRKASQWKPPVDHPWRNQFLWNKTKNNQPALIEK